MTQVPVNVVTGRDRGASFSTSMVAEVRLNKTLMVLTGGSRGIGLEIAKVCAELGSDVALLDVLEPQETISQMESQGGRVRFYK